MPVKIIRLTLIFCLIFFTTSCNLRSEPAGPPLEGDVNDLAGEFISNLVAEDYSAARAFFTTDMKDAMDENELEQAWQNTLSERGAYKGEIERFTEEIGKHVVINVITDFAKGPFKIRVTFDSDNRVAGLRFVPVED